jgi:hypothetical protein
MIKPSSSVASGPSCASNVGPPTPEQIARIIARLRAAGARVINRSGEDMRPADVEALVKEFFR